MGHARPSLSPDGEAMEPGHFGCPMLVRGHDPNGWGDGPLMRCSLGWAIHHQEDAARCVATPTMLECWRAERERALVAEPPSPAPRASKRRASLAPKTAQPISNDEAERSRERAEESTPETIVIEPATLERSESDVDSVVEPTLLMHEVEARIADD